MEQTNSGGAAQHTPGPLTATRVASDREGDQYKIANDYFSAQGEWRDKYVSFSGYFGSYGPHVFAAAPELLEALQAAALWVDGDLKNIVRAAIAKATGSAA